MHAKNIIIPDSVTKIDDCAFQNSALQEVTIPDSVTELGQCSFSACGNLEKVTLSKNLSVIPQDAFSICGSLKQITIPDSVISIEVAAFRDCDLLESITFSKNLQKISRSAFNGCKSLKEIELPNSLTTIENMAFYHTDLRVVEIPENVEVLEDAFNAQTLTSVILNNKLKTLYTVFPLEGKKFLIPNGVEKIENADFSVGDIAQLVIPGNVLSAEGSLFDGAANLNNLWIENSSIAIGGSVFACWKGKAGFYENGGIYGYAGSTAQQAAKDAGIPFYAVSKKDCGNGNSVTYAESEFTEGVTPTVEKMKSSDMEYSRLAQKINTEFAAYKVSFNGQAMVKVTAALPQGYDIDKCNAYMLTDSGEFEMVATDKMNGEFSFWANEGGTFVITQSKLHSIEYTKYYRLRFYGECDDWVYVEDFVVREGDTVQAPAWESKHHVVTGWDYDFSHVYEDAEIHPIWKELHQRADGVSLGEDGELHFYRNNQVVEDYNGFAYASDSSGKKYWFDYGVVARDKQVYDPQSDGWYWFDADGTMAVDKDVYVPESNENRANGKWVRYDQYGHMVKGTDYRYGGTYYFDEITGEMKKGFVEQNGNTYYYDNITGQKVESEADITVDGVVYKLGYSGELLNNNWWYDTDGNAYWYEGGIRQGLEGRGKEIYDPQSDAWYWLDAIDAGRKAVSKDVYQESSGGKWVRYDSYGHMIKGWASNGNSTWYFDTITGAMFKGWNCIDGIWRYFDEITGIEKQL